MGKNRAEIVQLVQDLTGWNDATFAPIIRRALNESIRTWARRRPWASLTREIDLVANGTRYLTLPDFIERPVYFFDKTNKAPILPGARWDQDFPGSFGEGTVGRPFDWKDAGYVATIGNPAGYVTAQSADVSDTGYVYLTGLVQDTTASGTALEWIKTQESITLNGQTPVTASNLFTEVYSFSTDSEDGDVTLLDEGNSSLPISRIPQYETAARFPRVQFLRIPQAGLVLEVAYLQTPPDLENDAQSPHPSIDEDFLKWHTAGIVLNNIGERQAGFAYIAKGEEVLAKADFREKNFGDRPIQMTPLTDYHGEEEAMLE
jgi:hypothetical protein